MKRSIDLKRLSADWVSKRLLLLLVSPFITLLFIGCSGSEESEAFVEETINGRIVEEPIWRVRRPSHWQKVSRHGSVADTTLPVQEWIIGQGEDPVTVQLHSFPSSSPEGRIPPMAQITRWQKQFSPHPVPEIELTNQAFSGYVGYLLDGRGEMKGKEVRVLAWAMSLPERSYHVLSKDAGKQRDLVIEKQSDLTIKAVGREEDVDRHEPEIRSFSRSLELIEPIPL